ncbi:formyltransferase family protein [Pseudoalteromonas sp. T1lg23B]|uniref:formyltransferase family protein n=1 Tax=Pseudoalteromonas sp. T1lg23B TaxID=2077097 RepID=UPI000CF6B718|nr:formyltransferase family protein [Pseudoalteromonas sp. T1lg23B]
MNRYAVFTGSCLSLPAIEYLHKANLLACVVLPDGEPNSDLLQLQQWLKHQQIAVLGYSNKDDQQLIASLDGLQAQKGMVYLFRHKIRKDLIQYFNQELVNIHPSHLPDYRGPQPLYWQIRNGETTTALTIHKVAEELDSGDIGYRVDIDIHPFETIKCLHQKVAQTLPYLVSNFIQLDKEHKLAWHKQPSGGNKLAPAIEHVDLFIDWFKHSTHEIVNMARAGNADMTCAVFRFSQSTFQLIQASKVDCTLSGIKPGTIIELDKSVGLIIKTSDGAVKLDIIGTQQGCFDGYRFAMLFALDPGMELESGAGNDFRY